MAPPRRRPATFSASHNIDVVPDSFRAGGGEAGSEPGVLIYGAAEPFLREEEEHWRNGQRSGQRDLIAAVEPWRKNTCKTFQVFGHPYVFVRP